VHSGQNGRSGQSGLKDFNFTSIMSTLSGCNKKKLHYFLALKGRNIPAQGNALGKYKKFFSPVRALHK